MEEIKRINQSINQSILQPTNTTSIRTQLNALYGHF